MSFQNHEVWANATTPMFLQVGSPVSSSQITLTSTPATTTGGVITQSGGYTFHAFTSSGTFITSTPVFAQILVVGGGGSGGGGNGGGGGGAGEVNFFSSSLAGSSTIVIGNGGAAAADGANGTNGQNTTITGGITVTALGGGGGASYDRNGLTGACGGGAGGGYSGTLTGGVGTEGFSGGNGYLGGYKSGGGGGIAGNGSSATSTTSGNGGVGRVYSVNGVSYSVGGGGGGGVIGGTNGVGVNGGGNGGNDAGANATAGTDGTGGGGGGGGYGATNGVGAKGGNGIVVISYLTSGTLVLTNQGGILAQNGVADIPTSQWSTTPAINNTIYMDTNHVITNSGNSLYFNGNLIANAADVSNIADWALYAAAADIQCSNGANPRRSILNASNVTANGTITGGTLVSTGNITGVNVIANTISNATNLSIVSGATSVGLLSNSFPQITNSAFSSISNVVDRLVDVAGDATYSIISKNGNRGVINLQANSGDNNEVSYGKINLTANGTKQTIGSVQYSYGGLLEMYANTPILTGAGVVATSAVKINGGGVNIYAGAFNSFGSVAGQLYLWGQTGASLTSSVGAPSPVTAGSVYIYGSNGTKVDGLVQMSNLSNISGSGFTINGGGETGSRISNFYSISAVGVSASNGGFERLPATTYISSPDSRPVVVYDLTIETFYQAAIPPFIPELKSSIYLKSGYNINMTTSGGGKVLYNGSEVLTSVANWSTIAATQTANLSNYGMNNVGSLSGVSTITGSGNINISNAAPYGLFLAAGTAGAFNASTELSFTSPRLLMTGDTTFYGTNTTVNFNFKRRLQTTDIAQPITQYGNGSGTGNAGNITITLPVAYTSSTSYNVFVTHTNSSPPNTSVVKNSSSQFTIYWTNGGAGTQPFDWMSIGT